MNYKCKSKTVLILPINIDIMSLCSIDIGCIVVDWSNCRSPSTMVTSFLQSDVAATFDFDDVPNAECPVQFV